MMNLSFAAVFVVQLIMCRLSLGEAAFGTMILDAQSTALESNHDGLDPEVC
jgi:hypothetical protein